MLEPLKARLWGAGCWRAAVTSLEGVESELCGHQHGSSDQELVGRLDYRAGSGAGPQRNSCRASVALGLSHTIITQGWPNRDHELQTHQKVHRPHHAALRVRPSSLQTLFFSPEAKRFQAIDYLRASGLQEHRYQTRLFDRAGRADSSANRYGLLSRPPWNAAVKDIDDSLHFLCPYHDPFCDVS